MYTLLPAGNTTHTNVRVYLAHPTMSINICPLRRLHTIMYPSNTQNIPHRIIYHYLLTSKKSPLVPRDRSLSLTIDNHIHSLTINHLSAPTIRLHNLHLFLNPYELVPYLLYTFVGGQRNNCTVSTQRLTITTSLPSSLIHSKRPQRQHMMRTMFHTPDLGTMITFPTELMQHQVTILTLATHILLSILVINAPHMVWNIVRHPQTQQNTINLLLATLTLQRKHPRWFTEVATSSPVTPVDSNKSLSNSASLVSEFRTQSTLQPTISPTRNLTTS